MRSYSLIISVILSVSFYSLCDGDESLLVAPPPPQTTHTMLVDADDSATGSALSLSDHYEPARSNGRLTSHQHQQRVDRDMGDSHRVTYAVIDDRADYYNTADSSNGVAASSDGRRIVNTYQHVSDGSSTGGSSEGDGWIIGGSRRRASAATEKYKHQDKMGKPDNKQWSSTVSFTKNDGLDAASSLSEVQVVVHHQQPHNNEFQQPPLSSSDVSSKWYSKRLSYVSKTMASPSAYGSQSHQNFQEQQQPLATAASNALLLAEVLGQKSGFNNTAAVYYAPLTATGSKGFQNDLMDMLGKSMCRCSCLHFLDFFFLNYKIMLCIITSTLLPVNKGSAV